MSATDHFSDAEVGQPVGGPGARVIVPCKVGSGGVTKGYFVKLSDGVTQEVVAAGAAKPYGVATKTVAEGGTVGVLVFGPVKMVAGGTFTANAPVTSDAAHKPAASSAYTDVGGVAMQSADVAGDSVLIFVGKV